MKLFLIVFILLAQTLPLYAQQQSAKRSYTTHHVNPHPPDIDGSLDDPAWQNIAWSGDFTQLRPDDGAPPSQQTAFKALYDDKNIYFAIRAFDTEPDKIERRMSRRDDFNSDWVEINIDSYFDRRTAFSFTLSSTGVRGDEAITNDGDDWDESWDPVWYGAAGIDDQGWTAEMRIPLSQLRYAGGDDQTWGLQVNRQLFRKDERSSWQYIPNNAPGWVSLFGELRGISGLRSSRRIELLPYTLGNVNRYQEETGNPFRSGQSADARFGLDGKIGLTSNLTLDMTINPDFGQVEADPSQVNLSAFEIFFQERRPFFVEGNNITEFRAGGWGSFGNDQLFYSRRIGRAPQRSPDLDSLQYMEMPDKTSIISAFKITGKTQNGLSIGVIDAITEKAIAEIDTRGARHKEAVEPSSNFLVTRLQKDYNDGATSIGGMFTATNRRIDRADLRFLNEAAYTGGFDFRHQWSNRTYSINGRMSFSHILGDEEAIIRAQRSSTRYYQRPDADHVTLDSTRTSLSGHGGFLSVERSGNSPWQTGIASTWRSPGLELNDLGFLRRADVVNQTAWIGYNSNKPFGIFRQYNFFTAQSNEWNFRGDRTGLDAFVDGGVQFNNYWWLWGSMSVDGNRLSSTALRGGPSMKTAGGQGFFAGIDTDDRRALRFGVGGGYRWNRDGDGRFSEIEFSTRYRPVNAMNIRIDPFFSVSRDKLQYVSTKSFQNSDRYVLGQIDQKTLGIRFRMDYSVTPNLSIQYYGQPFISAGTYSAFKRVTNPRADAYEDRFHTFAGDETQYDAGEDEYGFDEDLDGAVDYSIDNPNFNFRQFRSNLVLRWEYSPGSTFFLVWAQERTGSAKTGNFSARDDFDALFDVYPTNFFLVKFNRWFSL